MEAIGFTVIRFHDQEVLENVENIERVLEAYVEEFEK